ncbi:unnamed protein product [Choristocarpus tenellus]
MPATRGRYPIAIVGAGPVGLALSALLSRFQVPSILLEKNARLPTHPQAHFINLRTMEILRHAFCGLDEAVIRSSPPQREWRDFIMCSLVLGRQLARVDNFGGESARTARQILSPSAVVHLSQNRLLPILLEEARNSATKSCGASEIVFGMEVLGIQQERGQVSLSVRPPSIAANSCPQQISCDYLIAADGAHSIVRQHAGIDLHGHQAMSHLVNIHFTCEKLVERLPDRPGMLYFVYNEDIICVLVAHNVQEGEWACQVPYFPPHQSKEMFTQEYALNCIKSALGEEASTLPINIQSVRPWTMNALVAESYQDKAFGNIFLAGDSAHQFPPAGGFGLNTGVQDAHNLAWKLAAVHHKISNPDILYTYTQERRSVAKRNAALSVVNYKRSVRVAESLGVSLDLVNSGVIKKLAEQPLGFLIGDPSSRSRVADAALQFGRRHLRSLKYPGHPYGELRLHLLRKLLAAGGSLPLLFPAHDVGFIYESGALVQPTARLNSAKRRQDDGEITPLVTGGRMPHFPLAPATASVLQASQAFGERKDLCLTTVDLPDQLRGILCTTGCPESKLAMVLVILEGASGEWANAVKTFQEGGSQTSGTKTMMTTLFVTSHAQGVMQGSPVCESCPAAEDAEGCSHSAAGDGVILTSVERLSPFLGKKTLLCACEEERCEGWHSELYGVDITGRLKAAFDSAGAEAVLLRPDGHIGFLATRRSSMNGERSQVLAQLIEAMRSCFHGLEQG